MGAAVLSAPAAESTRVLMDLTPGERVTFAGTGIEIEVVAKSGRHARLCVISPKRVVIERGSRFARFEATVVK